MLGMSKFSRRLIIALLILLALPLGAFAYLNLQADKMIWYKYGRAYWLHSRPVVCDDYRRQYFRDLRHEAPATGTTEISCEQALNLPAESRYTSTADGMKIHYRVFPTPLKQAPLLLHIPGITSTWLNGARYAKAAERMGFQLVVMEMRNHGLSEHNTLGVGYGCREKADVPAVLSALRKDFNASKASRARPVMIWASSGATLTLVNAATTIQTEYPEVKALVLESAISSLRDVAKAKSPGLPEPVYGLAIGVAGWRAGLDFDSCAADALAGGVTLPTLLTATDEDTLTPIWMAQKINDQLPQKKTSLLAVYGSGAHEAIWNGQPAEYEADLKAHWLRALKP